MPYLIYGKRTEPWWNREKRRWEDPDKTFRAIGYKGYRVTKLEDAGSFATREDAQEYLDNHADPNKTDIAWEIRKVK